MSSFNRALFLFSKPILSILTKNRVHESFNTITPWTKKAFRHHSSDVLKKNFYQEHPNASQRTTAEIVAFEKEFKIMVRGENIAKPVFSFEEACFPDYIQKVLKAQNVAKVTPIQARCFPIFLSGRDVVAITRNGTGKILAYALPAIVHAKNQPPLNKGDSPICLLLAASVERCEKIRQVMEPFIASADIRCMFGYRSDFNEHGGTEICIATVNQAIRSFEKNFGRCTYLVLDEADRMLAFKWLSDIKKIVSLLRYDCQKIIWSATWGTQVRQFTESFRRDDTLVNFRSTDFTVNPNITQVVKVCDESDKFELVMTQIKEIMEGEEKKILVLARSRGRADRLMEDLKENGIEAECLLDITSQDDGNRVAEYFRQGRCSVVVATDVGAGDLDTSDIKCVINYDFPNTVDDYSWSLPHAARGLKTGVVFSLFTRQSAGLAGELICSLKRDKQVICPELADMAKNYRATVLPSYTSVVR